MYRNPARLRQFAAVLGLATASVPAVWLAEPVHAGGFALIEHGASGLGHAYAGAAAVSADTSTVWFNPAGMSEIRGREISAALHILSTGSEWTDEGTSLGYRLGGAEVSGPDTASPGTVSALPNFYYVAPINDQWSYGLSVGVPFGSSTEYDADWKGRYTTVKSGINILDVNPALSYQVSEKVRLGFGISLQRLTAELGNNVDSGAVCLSFAANPDTNFNNADCLNNLLTPGNQAVDSTAEITGDSIAFGFNLGALFLPTENVKIGVSYRHSIDHELDGDADFVVNPALRALLDNNNGAQTQAITQGFLQDGPATAAVELPASFSLSGAWQATNKVELLSDLTWTGWSSFQELKIVFDSPFQPDTRSVQEWEDVFRFSAGINYKQSPKLTLRAGYAFDEEPIPGPGRRTARIPGNDRTWLTVGAGYQVSSEFSFDIGFAHIMLDETAIDNLNEEQDGAGTVVRGVYDPSVNILSAQINYDFN
ncbi:MAG: OmpP1/FadL family transporter [Granulosicoccus sp.]